jgi:hypothetical protein
MSLNRSHFVELFISQETLEIWTEEGKAEMTQNQIKLSERGISKKMEPAVHVVAVVSGEDKLKYLHTIRTEKEIAALHGELYHSSLLINEEAYTVDPGFLVAY